MGQRLNIEITDNKGTELANCYYHWSAYSLSSLEEAMTVISNFDKLRKEIADNTLLAIRMFENCENAGLCEESYTAATEKYPNETFKKGTDRNNGLISITESDMNETRMYEEGRITINVDSKTIDFNVYFDTSDDSENLMYEAIEKKYGRDADPVNYSDEIIKEAIDEYTENCPKIAENFSFDLENIPFDKIEEFYNFLKDAADKGLYTLKYNETLICLIA